MERAHEGIAHLGPFPGQEEQHRLPAMYGARERHIPEASLHYGKGKKYGNFVEPIVHNV